MTSLHCLRADLLIERSAAGLSAAESLRLEDHVASCARCSANAKLLAGLRELSSGQSAPLSPLARERAIAGALASVPVERERSLSLRRPAMLSFAIACAAVVGAAIGLSLRPLAEHRATVATSKALQTAAAPAVAAAEIDRVLAGVVEVDGRLQPKGAELSAATKLSAPAGATLHLAQATLSLRPGSEMRWNREQRRVRLEAGSVVADVDPSAHQSFAVETAGFTAVVLGTRFSVSLSSVEVERGHVQVLAPDGRLLADLGEGQRFAPSAEPAAQDTASTALSARRQKPDHRTHEDATRLLGQARAQLGQKHVAQARQSIDAALALGPETSQRAEAMSLRAECDLVEGDLAGAVEAYLRVARAFAELPAGENALFAAARLEANRGRRAVAAQGLERYLVRYPNGRFVKEARARLIQLSADLDRSP